MASSKLHQTDDVEMLAHKLVFNSATGTRTRVARVRVEYPSQLDYSGLGGVFRVLCQKKYSGSLVSASQAVGISSPSAGSEGHGERLFCYARQTSSAMVPRGLEPRTLRLLAVRSNQLSYETSGCDARVCSSKIQCVRLM